MVPARQVARLLQIDTSSPEQLDEALKGVTRFGTNEASRLVQAFVVAHSSMIAGLTSQVVDRSVGGATRQPPATSEVWLRRLPRCHPAFVRQAHVFGLPREVARMKVEVDIEDLRRVLAAGYPDALEAHCAEEAYDRLWGVAFRGNVSDGRGFSAGFSEQSAL